jgi:hypothetical protein
LPTQQQSNILSLQGVGPGHVYTMTVEVAGIGIGGFNLHWCTDGEPSAVTDGNPACPA